MVRESGNDKYLDRIWDLTAPREAGHTKTCAWDEGFNFSVCLLEIVTTQINVLAAKAASVQPFKPNYRVWLVKSYLIETVCQSILFQPDAKTVNVV